MIEEIEMIDNNFHRDLLKSQGEKLVNYEKIFHKPAIDDIGSTEQIILTFEDTDEIDIESIIGKRLLDYGEMFFDTFNTNTGNMQRITLIFQEDYKINIDGYNLIIEKYTQK